jgi:RNA polymerase sigma factor (sigma-70 family)
MRSSPLRHPARLAGASLLRLQSDARLAELAVAGHEAAFAAIVDRYRTPLARYCAGIVGPNRAEDAVQQALINAHDALQRTDEVRHLRSWLYRIAHNASLNVLRAVRDDVSLEDAERSGSLAGGLGPDDDGPAATFERSERFRATVAALQELPERQRAALVLRELEGRSHQEIADALGVTTGSARQHLMRARIAVRGAVTAVTPYPLIVRLAEALTTPGTAAWSDAAVGAGATATLAKLTAGIAATGALVGGAVGTERVVHDHRGGASATAAAREAESAVHEARSGATGAAQRIVVSQAATVLPVAAAGSGGAGSGDASSQPHHGSDSSGHGSSGHDNSGSPGGHGSDDTDDDRSGTSDDAQRNRGGTTSPTTSRRNRGHDDSTDNGDDNDGSSQPKSSPSRGKSSDDGESTTSSGKLKREDSTAAPTTSSESESDSGGDTHTSGDEGSGSSGSDGGGSERSGSSDGSGISGSSNSDANLTANPSTTTPSTPTTGSGSGDGD